MGEVTGPEWEDVGYGGVLVSELLGEVTGPEWDDVGYGVLV